MKYHAGHWNVRCTGELIIDVPVGATDSPEIDWDFAIAKLEGKMESLSEILAARYIYTRMGNTVWTDEHGDRIRTCTFRLRAIDFSEPAPFSIAMCEGK